MDFHKYIESEFVISFKLMNIVGFFRLLQGNKRNTSLNSYIVPFNALAIYTLWHIICVLLVTHSIFSLDWVAYVYGYFDVIHLVCLGMSFFFVCCVFVVVVIHPQ